MHVSLNMDVLHLSQDTQKLLNTGENIYKRKEDIVARNVNYGSLAIE